MNSYKELKPYQKAVYKDTRWNYIRNEVIKRDKGICCFCGKLVLKRGIIHHKQEINEENYGDWNIAFNLDNLVLCHQECHNTHHHLVGYRQTIVKDDLSIDYTKR